MCGEREGEKEMVQQMYSKMDELLWREDHNKRKMLYREGHEWDMVYKEGG